MKKCFRCGEEKPLSEYYKHPKMADGHLNKCKECAKSDSRKRGSDPEYERKRNKLPHRVEARKAYAKTEAGRLAANRSKRKYCANNPRKRKAHSAVSNAIRDGKLERGTECEVCKATEKLHAHHDDYAKFLDIRWLCVACHKAWHLVNGEAKNPF